ncbi:MAG: hypothetical protein QM800_05390 [Paludibacter sp.]
MKSVKLLFFFAFTLLLACNGGEPPLPYTYNANPRYTWGYAEYFGKEYADFGIDNNIISLSLFSDSLSIDSTQSLVGIGQYLFLEDIFVSPTGKFLPDGTYTVDTTGLPFTVSPGRIDTVGTEMFPIGATISYYEENTSKSKLLYVTSGNFVVATSILNDTTYYTINCDFRTNDKKALKGSFNGQLIHFDESLTPRRDLIRKKQHKFIGF